MLAIAITILFIDKSSVNPCACIVAPWERSLNYLSVELNIHALNLENS